MPNVILIDVNVCLMKMFKYSSSTPHAGEVNQLVFEAVFCGNIMVSFIILYKYEFKLEIDQSISRSKTWRK